MAKFDEDAVDETALKLGGYTFKPVHFLVIGPVLSAIAGGVYWSYDAYNRFLDVEDNINSVLAAEGRIQALEQTIGDNDVANLSSQLSSISTNMRTILEQQKNLLDLRSKVERAELITSGIGDKLDRLQADIDSTWDAIDALEKPPMTNDYDLNGNGKIDADEREIMLEDMRRKMDDADAKRDAQRKMAWFSLTGMLVFPFGVVLTEYMQLPQASTLLSSMSNIYYVSIAAIVGAYYGFTNMSKSD